AEDRPKQEDRRCRDRHYSQPSRGEIGAQQGHPITAATAVKAHTTGTLPCNWLSATTADCSLVALARAVSDAMEVNPVEMNTAETTAIATPSPCCPARHHNGTRPAGTAMKASNANATAISLANKAARCAVSYAATTAGDESAGPSPCPRRSSRYKTAKAN